MFRLRLIAPIAILALAGCSSATDVGLPLDISLSVDHPVIGPSNSAAVEVHVVNRSGRTVATSHPQSYDCIRPYVVENGSGDVVPQQGRSCLLVLYPPVELAPGDSIVIHDTWAGDKTDGNYESVRVAPGQYRLVARVFADGREMSSAPAAVTVTAP